MAEYVDVSDINSGFKRRATEIEDQQERSLHPEDVGKFSDEVSPPTTDETMEDSENIFNKKAHSSSFMLDFEEQRTSAEYSSTDQEVKECENSEIYLVLGGKGNGRTVEIVDKKDSEKGEVEFSVPNRETKNFPVDKLIVGEVDKKPSFTSFPDANQIREMATGTGESEGRVEKETKQCHERSSLKIEVIDQTAVIEVFPVLPATETRILCRNEKELARFESNKEKSERRNTSQELHLRKEKRPRRRVTRAKKGLETNEKGSSLNILNTSGVMGEICCVKDEDWRKRVYSRKEMEAMRFVNVGKQKKMWYELYSGLESAVAREYDDLVNNAAKTYNKHSHVNYDSRQQMGKKEEASGICGAVCSANADNETESMKNIFFESTQSSLPAGTSGVDGKEDGDTGPQEECSDNDSECEYDSILRPAFLVDGEPNFDSGDPEDGWEYLRRVRWEAARIPNVKVANLDQEKINKEQTAYMPDIPAIVKCSENLLPMKEWEETFLADFAELRQALSCAEGPCSSRDETPSHDYPKLSAVLKMDSVARVSSLRKRISSVETASALSKSDCAWLFALCAAVDAPLDAHTCAALRSLLRWCARVRAAKSELDEEAVMLNILATISGKYFGQSEH